MNKWRLAAHEAIEAAIAQMQHEGIIPHRGKLSEAQKKEFKKRINNAYPFGERKYHPYKIWLEVRKQTFYRYGCLQPLDTSKLPLFNKKSCNYSNPNSQTGQ